MRVTFNMRGMQMKDMLSTSLSNYTEAVKKANAQKSLLNPWEDTSKYVGAYNVLNMIDELTQFSENANSASNWLNNTNAELQELLEALKKARDDYAIAGASDSYDEESRKALAQDVLSLYNQIMDIANASYNGRYIFGGFQTEKPPFTGGTNSVTNVVTKNENGENLSGDAIVKDVFSDMTELKSGKYTAKMVVDNNTGIAKLQLYDEKGNVVIMDSNGSDEAGGSGNKSAVSMTFEYEPGKVINTGRGVNLIAKGRSPCTNGISCCSGIPCSSGRVLHLLRCKFSDCISLSANFDRAVLYSSCRPVCVRSDRLTVDIAVCLHACTES